MYLKKAFRSFGQLLFLVALDKPTPSLVSSQIWKKKKKKVQNTVFLARRFLMFLDNSCLAVRQWVCEYQES